MRDVGLLSDVLVLIGAFSLGFLAGVLFAPLRNLVTGLWHAPGRMLRGTQNVGQRMRQAFGGSLSEQNLDRTGVTGKLAGAIADVLTLGVRHAEASFREGLAAFDRGDPEQARSKLTEALFWDRRVELRPLHVMAHLHLGWLDEEQGTLAKAKAHYQQAAHLDATNLAATLRLGMMHFQLGETGPAISQLQRALELDPTSLDTHYYLYAIYRRAGMETEAHEQLRIIKAGEDATRLAELFSRHGEDHFRMSRYAEATDDYQLALQFSPTCAAHYLPLGDLYHLQQQSHTALETWCRGLWVDYSDAMAERVLTVAQADVDPHPAIQLVRECMVRHPRDGRYCFLLSRLLRRIGDDVEALAALTKAVRLTPGLLEGQQELGDSLSDRGQTAQAGDTYRAGLHAARSQEAVFRCRICGHVTREEQARCFQCSRWDTLEKMTRAEALFTAPATLLERAGAVRQRLQATWTRIAGQLPPAP
jgi:tetratricopeptide (TPR) repeat protein